SCLYRPVRLEIDRLVPLQAGGGEPLLPDRQEGGRIVFPPARQGRVELQGRVLWDEEDDDRLRKATLVRVYVNGFQQLPAELEPPAGGGRERRFRTPLLFNQAEDNRVEIALPGLAQDAASWAHFSVSCTDPQRGQRFHLLLVSAREAAAAGAEA